MLLFCNGPYKSGSTWLYNLIKEACDPDSPPNEQCDTGWKHPSLREANIAEFAESVENRSRVFLSKHHFRPETVEKLAYLAPSHALFFSVERNLPDALVSAWHHHQKRHDVALSFESFYWRFGRANALGIINHHRAMGRLRQDQALTLSYEKLLQEPEKEILRLILFLGDLACVTDPGAISRATSIDRLRDKYDAGSVVNGKAFFRKGRAGDGKAFVKGLIASDLTHIERNTIELPHWRLIAKFYGLICQ